MDFTNLQFLPMNYEMRELASKTIIGYPGFVYHTFTGKKAMYVIQYVDENLIAYVTQPYAFYETAF